VLRPSAATLLHAPGPAALLHPAHPPAASAVASAML
jgi:hypothetical protein